MAEPDTQPHAEGTLSAVQRLMQSINKPPKTSSDFASSSSRTQARNTNSFRAIAAAPSTEDPATAVSLANLSKAGKSRKRKASKDEGEGAAVKKKRGPKAKKEVSKPVLKLKGKKTATIPELPGELWVRIAEFCAPKDFNKLRLVCRSINGALVHWQNQVRQGQIREWYPEYMPKTFANLNEQQYNNLLGAGKGCMAPGCQDKRASKTYWPFARRWCADCYQKYTMKVSQCRPFCFSWTMLTIFSGETFSVSIWRGFVGAIRNMSIPIPFSSVFLTASAIHTANPIIQLLKALLLTTTRSCIGSVM